MSQVLPQKRAKTRATRMKNIRKINDINRERCDIKCLKQKKRKCGSLEYIRPTKKPKLYHAKSLSNYDINIYNRNNIKTNNNDILNENSLSKYQPKIYKRMEINKRKKKRNNKYKENPVKIYRNIINNIESNKENICNNISNNNSNDSVISPLILKPFVTLSLSPKKESKLTNNFEMLSFSEEQTCINKNNKFKGKIKNNNRKRKCIDTGDTTDEDDDLYYDPKNNDNKNNNNRKYIKIHTNLYRKKRKIIPTIMGSNDFKCFQTHKTEYKPIKPKQRNNIKPKSKHSKGMKALQKNKPQNILKSKKMNINITKDNENIKPSIVKSFTLPTESSKIKSKSINIKPKNIKHKTYTKNTSNNDWTSNDNLNEILKDNDNYCELGEQIFRTNKMISKPVKLSEIFKGQSFVLINKKVRPIDSRRETKLFNKKILDR
mmetsp:Transcript_43864/g.53800  ORF Transcript_43864/g.53800 Transcript_43864/m.53800 type:complete len:433 (-) Transcript_43864:13-1311(-)